MGSRKTSSVGKGDQWRRDFNMKPPEPMQIPAPDVSVMPPMPNATVCCDKKNCERAKLEAMPEQYYGERATQPYVTNKPDGRMAKTAKKEIPMPPPAEPFIPFCPCMLNGGQLVTICCTNLDCDEASKIDEPPQKNPKMNNNSHYKY